MKNETGRHAATGDGLSGQGTADTDTAATDVVVDSHEIQSGKLAGKTLPAAIAMLAIPVLLEHFANATVGTVDVMLTGHLPGDIATPAMDGVGIGSYVRWFMGISAGAVGIGGMALIARAIGAGNKRLAHLALGQAVGFSLLLGIVVTFIMWFGIPWVAKLAGLSPEASAYCIQYVRVVALSMPTTSLLFTGTMCLHGAGETTRPFLIMLVVNAVNVFLSWMLSGVDLEFESWSLLNPFSFDLHVMGIAAGTAGARTVGAFLLVLLMLRGIKDLKLQLPDIRPQFETMWRIIRVGFPNFVEGFGMWAGQLVGVIWLIGKIAEKTGAGEGLMGAHMIAVQWEAFSFMPGFALGTAAGTLAGQYLGAGNPKMASRSIWLCAILGMALMGIAGVVFMFAGAPLTRIISDDPQHLELAPKLLFICGIVQINFAMAMVIRNGLRGAGDTRACMIITWTSTYFVRIPLAWLFGYWLGFGLVGVWIGLCAELFVRGLLFLGRFLQGGWKTVRV
ncbi:MAG: MATE family efflux transporter [Planctomycetes bacterium]|nr:MATE family efflux transporter [Planctomycetota bacterium]NOG54310.1 MATE family efflux transporter [Planctomycetota bacterium]